MAEQLSMDCTAFKHRLDQIRTITEHAHSLESFRCDPPAASNEIDAIELDIPDPIRNFFSTCSQHVTIAYRLNKPLDPPFEEVFSGEFSLSLHEMPRRHEHMTQWLNSNRPLLDSANFIPVMTVSDGDIILYERSSGLVHCFSHEDEDEDLVLENSFNAFLTFCASIGFLGNESWQYAPFLKNRTAVTQINQLLWT